MASPNSSDRHHVNAAQALFSRSNPALSNSGSDLNSNQDPVTSPTLPGHLAHLPTLAPRPFLRSPRVFIPSLPSTQTPTSSTTGIPTTTSTAITPTRVITANTPTVYAPPARTPAPTTPAYTPTPSRFTPGPVSAPSPLWKYNAEEIGLIRAGYTPCYSADQKESNLFEGSGKGTGSKKGKRRMAEPRARAARHKGQMNFAAELRLLLLAYGDPSPHPSFPAEPLPETVRVLDEIVTDFVLEMCHNAAQYANYSRRQKIKVDDFRFALRRDPNKLGRVQELLRMERELKEARKAFDQNDDQVAKDAAGKKALEEVAESVDGTTTAGKKSKGKGKRGARRDSVTTEESVTKKRKLTM